MGAAIDRGRSDLSKPLQSQPLALLQSSLEQHQLLLLALLKPEWKSKSLQFYWARPPSGFSSLRRRFCRNDRCRNHVDVSWTTRRCNWRGTPVTNA